MDFYHYMVVVYTHCQHTFQFKQLVKVHVALYDIFKYCKAAPRVEYLLWRVPSMSFKVLLWKQDSGDCFKCLERDKRGSVQSLYTHKTTNTSKAYAHKSANRPVFVISKDFLQPQAQISLPTFDIHCCFLIPFFFFSLHISQPLKASLKFTATKLCLTGLRSTLAKWEKTLLGLQQARVSLK